MTPTPQTVIDFWLFMSQRFNSKVVPKSESGRMAAAAWFLDAIDVMDKETFLDRYTTTIGRTIYVPFEIGTDDRSLWGQIQLCAHEHMHVIQYDCERGLFYTNYLLHKSKRAEYEAQATVAELEIIYWRTGKKIAQSVARQQAEPFKAYSLDKANINFIEQYLISAIETINQGGIITPAGRAAVEWLDEHGG